MTSIFRKPLANTQVKFQLFLIALAIPLLCSCTNLIWTSEPVITMPTDHDFRFVGQWELVPDPRLADEENPVASMTISRVKESNTQYNVEIANEGGTLEFTFAAARLSDDSEQAIVQLNTARGEIQPNYYYGYAKRTEDTLYVWTIEADQLVKRIKDEKLNSVIDRGTFSTQLTADSKKLLEMFANNSDSLASKKPTIFKLKP